MVDYSFDSTRGGSLEPLDEHQLRSLFPRTQHKDLAFPDLEPVDWGILDYFGWIHPSGRRGYVVMPTGDDLKSLTLRRSASTSGKPRTHMCSWCHHVYRGRGTAMFSTFVAGSDERRLIGNHICSHLDCSLRIRNLTSDPPTYMPETIDLTRKVLRLENAVLAFMARANLISV